VVWSVPAMLAIAVLFAPGLLAFLLLAGALECYLLKRPEERAAHAAEPAMTPTPPAALQADPEPVTGQAQPVAATAQPAMPEEPAPLPIPAHLPSAPGAAAPLLGFGNDAPGTASGRPALHPSDQAEPLAD
jgi:hypothetical protein